ncbi:prevent-host-death family protein [Kribbella flavida DSM 17836]|uniref:Antitoxin n=1 Tax=Kribbella flavida (strain DSM 17836 / JCM 10339 / NBRC 14399) TaxID=479435 RepID=D2PVM9_KRIFD|nr:type II toxin-antitoxin system prevent-host-death family antitoxin [Kribbella flavida]ADB35269.1 prevent-host-death family protein [Kribbella flavida DSM 17836]
MDALGLRELRQNASDLVRRAEAGEHLVITVSGRPAAVLGPAERDHWRRYDEVADVLRVRSDDEWAADRELVDDELRDPWTAVEDT